MLEITINNVDENVAASIMFPYLVATGEKEGVNICNSL
jgi:hypothetical protein